MACVLAVFPLGGLWTVPDGASVWFGTLGLVTDLQTDFSLVLVQS